MKIETKSVKVTYKRKTGYIHLLLTGTYEQDDFNKIIEAFQKKGIQKKMIRVICDITGVKGSIPDIHRFKFGEQVAAAFGPTIRIALINRPEEINKLFEHTAVNRSGDVLVTSDEKEALEWLLKN